MHKKGWALLRSLLNKQGYKLSHQEFSDTFLSDLPQDERDTLLALDTTSQDPSLALSFRPNVLNSMHYSWLINPVNDLPPLIRQRILPILPPHLSRKLAGRDILPEQERQYLPEIKAMLMDIFYKHLAIDNVLPKEYLPPTTMSKLLDLNKEELVTLIDLLSMHDLAEEIRQVIDNKMIKAIYLSLKPHQHRHLYLCLHQQEKVMAPPLELDSWDGSPKSLLRKLHIRGIMRLGKALSGQPGDFIWHIVHTLDTGRGKLLSRYVGDAPQEKVTPLLQQQVIQTMNYLHSQPKKAGVTKP